MLIKGFRRRREIRGENPRR